MKYFLDTEFIEGTQSYGNPFVNIWIGKKQPVKPTIDLISIAIVAEDGREYYAISKDFNLYEAWNRWQQRTGQGDYNRINPREYWIRENVLKPIYNELIKNEIDNYTGFTDPYYELELDFTYRNFKRLINKYGKTNKQIAIEIYDFISETTYETEGFKASLNENLNPEFYGYFADYDWVAFCWLFGRMIDLPNGFPRYCIDLKQTLDEKAWKTYCNNGTLDSETSLEERLKYLKGESNTNLIEPYKPKYPKQTNEHSALQDAHFNYNLYKFLQII